jgi:hypothetical protein
VGSAAGAPRILDFLEKFCPYPFSISFFFYPTMVRRLVAPSCLRRSIMRSEHGSSFGSATRWRRCDAAMLLLLLMGATAAFSLTSPASTASAEIIPLTVDRMKEIVGAACPSADCCCDFTACSPAGCTASPVCTRGTGVSAGFCWQTTKRDYESCTKEKQGTQCHQTSTSNCANDYIKALEPGYDDCSYVGACETNPSGCGAIAKNCSTPCGL